MVKTSTAQAALATLVQMDLAISERLADDPQTLALFDAYNHLFDSLYLGLSQSLPNDPDQLVHRKLNLAQETLTKLGVMGRPLPNKSAS